MYINPGIQESLDNIFGAVLVGGIDRSDTSKIQLKKSVLQYSMNKFLSTYGDNIFEGEYAFFYSVLRY